MEFITKNFWKINKCLKIKVWTASFIYFDFFGAWRLSIFISLYLIFRPVSLINLHPVLNVSEGFFLMVWIKMINSGKIACIGFLYGLKNSLKSIFVPKIHMRFAEIYLKNLITLNGYIGELINSFTISCLKIYCKVILW